MHYKQEDNSLKHCLAGVPEYESHKHKLRAQEEQELAGGNSQYKKPNDHYNNPDYNINNLVQLVDSSLCVVQGQGKGSPLSEGIDLNSLTKISWNVKRTQENNQVRDCVTGVSEVFHIISCMITSQFLRSDLLIFLLSAAPSKRLIVFNASSSCMNRIKSSR